jgi:hypothetical protein
MMNIYPILMHRDVTAGLYTLLFGYTLRRPKFLSLNKSRLTVSNLAESLARKEKQKSYAAVLTLLWVLVMLSFSLDWQHHRSAFVLHNDSPLDIANEMLNTGSNPLAILENTASISCIWLADAVLVRQSDSRPYAALSSFIPRFGAATFFGKIKNGCFYLFQ